LPGGADPSKGPENPKAGGPSGAETPKRGLRLGPGRCIGASLGPGGKRDGIGAPGKGDPSLEKAAFWARARGKWGGGGRAHLRPKVDRGGLSQGSGAAGAKKF